MCNLATVTFIYGQQEIWTHLIPLQLSGHVNKSITLLCMPEGMDELWDFKNYNTSTVNVQWILFLLLQWCQQTLHDQNNTWKILNCMRTLRAIVTHILNDLVHRVHSYMGVTHASANRGLHSLLQWKSHWLALVAWTTLPVIRFCSTANHTMQFKTQNK